MSDIQECKELLKRYSVARIPFISINTIEPGRTLDALKEIAEDLQLPFYVHSLTKGVYDISTEKSLSDDKSVYGAIDFMTEQMKRKQRKITNLSQIFLRMKILRKISKMTLTSRKMNPWNLPTLIKLNKLKKSKNS